MKKVILSVILSCSLFAAGEVYSEAVRDVYLDATSNKSIGRLLPTNAVKILETKGDRVKISVKGYQNPAVSNVVYFSDSERVIAVAFAKAATPEIKLIKKGQNGKWDEVETIVYTSKDGFTNDLNGLFKKAKATYMENCGICHKAHDENHYKANQWPALLKSMISRTSISKDDEWLVVQYLQKHSADVKVK